MKWGTKNSNNIPLINARTENASLYYKNWNRCVILISGYYEWKKIKQKSDPDKTSASVPFYIRDRSVNHFKLAGVYKRVVDEV